MYAKDRGELFGRLLRSIGLVTIVLCLPICLITAAAQNKQNKPDLTGTWEFDQRQSYPASTRGQFSSILTIVQRDPEIRMTTELILEGQETVREVVLYTDGRVEQNVGYTGHAAHRKSEWDGRTLVTKYSRTYTSVGWTKHDIEEIERWQLSKDGKILTRKRIGLEWPNSFGPYLSKAVYRRIR